MDCSTVWPLHQLSSALTVSTQRETGFSFETIPLVPRYPVVGFSPLDGPSFEVAYWLTGLLHPAAGHGVRCVFDLFSRPSSPTSRWVVPFVLKSSSSQRWTLWSFPLTRSCVSVTACVLPRWPSPFRLTLLSLPRVPASHAHAAPPVTWSCLVSVSRLLRASCCSPKRTAVVRQFRGALPPRLRGLRVRQVSLPRSLLSAIAVG
jgi:hypothetical protein